MTLVEMHVKWSVTVTDRLGPEILTVLEIKGQVLHRVQIHHFNQQIHHFNHILKDAAPKALNSLGDDYVTYLK